MWPGSISQILLISLNNAFDLSLLLMKLLSKIIIETAFGVLIVIWVYHWKPDNYIFHTTDISIKKDLVPGLCECETVFIWS